MIKRYPIDSIGAGLKKALRPFNTLIGLMLCVLVFASIGVQATLPDFSDTVSANINQDPGFEPSVESDLILWLDAKNINANNNAGISSGNTIETWKDLSGKDNDVSQSKSLKQPIYSTNAGGSLNFNGSSTRFSVDISGLLNSDYTIISVHKKTNTSRAYILSTGGNNSTYNGTDKKLMFGYNAYPGNPTYGPIYNNRFTVDHYGNPGLFDNEMPTNQTITTVGRLDSSTYPYRHAFINGVKKDPETGIISGHELREPTPAKLVNTNEAHVGYGHGNSYFKGEMYELLVFKDALSDSDITKIQYYLSKKWGLESSMDSDNDTLPDELEISAGSDPIDPNSPEKPDFLVTVSGEILQDPNFSNNVTSNLVLWLDASNINLFNNVGINPDEVGTWRDLSVNDHHATTAPNKLSNPRYVTDNTSEYIEFMQSGSTGLVFSGIGSGCVLTNSGTTFSNPGGCGVEIGDDWTIFIVNKMEFTGGNWHTLFRGHKDNGINGAHHIIVEKNSKELGVYKNDGGGYQSSGIDLDIFTGNGVILAEGSGDTTSFTVNGSTTGSAPYKPDKAIYSVGNYHNGDSSGGGQGFGKVSEILIFKTQLNDEDIYKINYYLSKKWSLESTMDSDGDGFTDKKEIDDESDPINLNSIPASDTDSDGVKDEWDYFPSDSNQYFWPSIVLTSSGPTFNTLDLAIQHITPNGIIYLADGNYGMTEGTTKNVEIKRKSGATNVSITLNARAN